MRNLVSLGLLALIMSVFSISTFAGNVEECEFLKDKSHPDYIPVPGLYGLCVAWNNASANANQQAMDRIAQKYAEKSGGLEVPGSGDPEPEPPPPPPPLFECPCWAELNLGYICDLGAPVFDSLELYDDTDPEFADVFQGVVGFINSAGGLESFGTFVDLASCAHTINSKGPTEDTLSSAEALICGMEIGEIRSMNTTADCSN